MEFTTDPVSAILDEKVKDIYSIEPNQTVYEAIELMSKLGIGALLVLENEKLVGIISERDYARKVILAGRTSREARVRDIMTSNIIVISPTDTVDNCMKLLTKHQIRHLPVVDGKKLVGMISATDLVRWIISRQSETIEQLEHYISSGYVR